MDRSVWPPVIMDGLEFVAGMTAFIAAFMSLSYSFPGSVSSEVIWTWSISFPWMRCHLAFAVAGLMRHPSDRPEGGERMGWQALRVSSFPPGQGQDKRPLILESDREPWQAVRKASPWKMADQLNAGGWKGQEFVFLNTYMVSARLDLHIRSHKNFISPQWVVGHATLELRPLSALTVPTSWSPSLSASHSNQVLSSSLPLNSFYQGHQ